MYFVRILRKNKSLIELVTAESKSIINLIDLLENYHDVVNYKIVGPTGNTLFPCSFGWGDMPKWVPNNFS